MRELLSPKNLEYQDRAREVAEKFVRPRAAELDRSGEYGWDILEALKSYRLTGIWIPEEYGGEGAGVLDLCLVVEQLSRACGGRRASRTRSTRSARSRSSSAAPRSRRGGTCRRSPAARADRLRPVREVAGSDAGSLRTAAIRDGARLRPQRREEVEHERRRRRTFTVFAVTDPDKGMRGISAFIVEKGTPGFSIGKVRTRWASAACRSSSSTSRTAGCRSPQAPRRQAGRRLPARDDDARPGPSRRGGAGARPRAGRARVRACATPRSASSSARRSSRFQMIQ